MKDNISKFKDCYGCGVCVIACPKKIIDIELNKDGFYSPIIKNPDECINCGICLEICAYNHTELASPPDLKNVQAFGCWSKNDEIREESTTGGIGYEIALDAIKKGSKVCAVKYNIKNELAEHYVTSSINGLKEAKGSKYIPSFTKPGFEQINSTDKFTVFGLPCQIDSFRRYIKKFRIEHNFRLVDLLCHGTPSLLLWRRYLAENCDKFGEVKSVKFRSKEYGWHKSSCVEIDGKKSKLIQDSSHCLFYSLFFSDSCLNKCCHGKCKYKLMASSADVRIGDFWGKKYENNDKGVNVMFAFTEDGNKVVTELSDSCVFQPVTLEEAMGNQMAHNAPDTIYRKFLLWGFRKNIKLKILYYIVRVGKLMTNPQIVINKFRIIYNKKFSIRKDEN